VLVLASARQLIFFLQDRRLPLAQPLRQTRGKPATKRQGAPEGLKPAPA
jgi:hypothetical protein